MLQYFRSTALVVAAILSGLAAPTVAQGEVENPPDPYIHKVAQIAFPAQAGDFIRGRVVEFDESGSDASVGYRPQDMPGEMSIYVYPLAGSSCRDQFEGADAPILDRGGTVREADAGLAITRFAGLTQYSRSYTIEPGGYGFAHPELVSFLWVGCPPGDEWVVKYRGSFVAGDAERATGIEDRLFSQIDWSRLVGDSNNR